MTPPNRKNKKIERDPPVRFSIIIPAYNEADRLPKFISRALPYLDREFSREYEVVVVDDGSNDGTVAQMEALSKDRANIRILRHEVNSGKGAAVKTGMLAARGELLLFADADGATPIGEEKRLREAIRVGADIAIGSRAASVIKGDSRLASRLSPMEKVEWKVQTHRHVMGRVFAMLVKLILGIKYDDTQCGFKMFTQQAAIDLFSRASQQQFIFDCEILYLAEKLGYQVLEIPVNWHEVSGSKVNIFRDSLQMLLGLWKINRTHKHLKRMTTSSALSVHPALEIDDAAEILLKKKKAAGEE